MTICESTDFIFPLQADVYYAVTETTAYGNITKTWILDKTIACSFSEAGPEAKEKIIPDPDMKFQMILLGRTKNDIRMSKREVPNAATNVIITNIRDKSGIEIYSETSGPRANKSTIFEIAAQNPFVNPFGEVEYYALTLRRSENQGVDA
jgi:hypothetical protein